MHKIFIYECKFILSYEIIIVIKIEINSIIFFADLVMMPRLFFLEMKRISLDRLIR